MGADIERHYDVVAKIVAVKNVTVTPDTSRYNSTPAPGPTKDRSHRTVIEISTTADDKATAIRKAIKLLEVELEETEVQVAAASKDVLDHFSGQTR